MLAAALRRFRRSPLALSLAFVLIAGACSVVNAPEDPVAGANTGGSTGGTGGSGGNPNPNCGDGTVDSTLGETCDPPSSCPTSCDDGDACTLVELVGSADSCDAECTSEAITLCLADPDGCCPDGCDGFSDSDCATCNNGLVELGETCDGDCPATCDDLDLCTSDSSQGDASTCDLICDNQPITQCADGDGCCPGSCGPTSDSDCAGWVYATSSNGTAGFYGYDVATDSWLTLPNPPSVTYSQLTTDGSVVYSMGSDNTIYRFTPSTSSWTAVHAGPGATTANPIGLFKWTAAGFHYANDGETTLYRWTGGAWESMTLPQSPSCAGTYEPASGLLYIREYSSQGLIIWDTTSNGPYQYWSNGESCGENSRTGTYYDGFFYTRDWATPFNRMDVDSGQVTATAITPSESHTATDVNPATGDIFIGPYTPSGTNFQIYNVPSNTLIDRAPLPAAVTNHSTLVFVAYPE